MVKLLALALFGASLCASSLSYTAPGSPMAAIDALIASHPHQSGALVLDTGAEALVARAWLVDHAERSIEAQYFIWSSDNIGILAAESLLRAADRGVKVRVVVDDILINAPDKSLLALALHPNIEIKVYNPKHSVGTPLPRRLTNMLVDFRGFNQRMHDKVLIIDGKAAITGGRNVAAEYYDYNGKYNFRDRDALIFGDAVVAMRASFERFWASPISVSVEERFYGQGLLRGTVRVDDAAVKRVYTELHDYARDPGNFAPEVRAAIKDVPGAFERVADQIAWGRVEFLSDRPGKNETRRGLGGGGATGKALGELVQGARETIVIQSPYLVLSDEAMALFRAARARGVKVRIHTNSLASTDNLPAFSGYRNQRKALLAMGLEIFEFKPHPEIQRELMRRAGAPSGPPPLFAVHAKTMVVDSRLAFIGTYNFDPRSQNLNTEVGVVVHDGGFARAVERAIDIDMAPANSWSARDNPDQHASSTKRAEARALQMTPVKPLL